VITRAVIACAVVVELGAGGSLARADVRVATIVVRADVESACRVQASEGDGVVALVVRCNASPSPAIAVGEPAGRSVTVVVNL